MKASLVWDGGEDVVIPPEMGEPRKDQMLGSAGERLSELSGRVCYGSLGRGRTTDEYHAHLLQVGHGSVYEHYTRTVEISFREKFNTEILMVFQNRQGVWVEELAGTLRVTMNIRSALEWRGWTNSFISEDQRYLDMSIGRMIQDLWHKEVPRIVPHASTTGIFLSPQVSEIRFVPPVSDHEKWVSLYMSGSRGFSHEQVRHGNETAISQRSTRYVQESESPWVVHPLLEEYLKEDSDIVLQKQMEDVISASQRTYDNIVVKLERWLLSRIPESDPFRKSTARKQARGAARGFLGNALKTDMIFSASVAEWKHMCNMRAADAADAEIRMIYNHVLLALQESRYGERFKDLSLVPASDGLGLSLKGGGAT